MKQAVEKIKDGLSPSAVISKKVSLKQKAPGEYLGLCPFHSEKTPSFTVSDEKGFYHCFGCGAHGDIIGFTMQSDGLAYKDAVEKLAQESGVELPKYNNKTIEIEQRENKFFEIFEITTKYYESKLFSDEGKEALSYLKRRGLTLETIKKFRLGFAPINHSELREKWLSKFDQNTIIESTVLLKSQNGNEYNLLKGRVIFPILNSKNRVIAFGGRILGIGEPKYINSPDNPIFKKGSELYGLNFAGKTSFKAKEIILVEGYMDVISLSNYGVGTAVAPLGTAVKLKQIELLWKYVDEPTVCMDSDLAGKRSTLKITKDSLSNLKPNKSLKICTLLDAKDPDEFISKFGIEAFQTALKNSRPLSEFLFETEKERTGISTPEKRVELKHDLIALADSIQDKEISKSYRYFFLEKFSKMFRENKANDKFKENEKSIFTTLNRANSLEAIIIRTFLKYPDMLKDNFLNNELMNLEIECKNLDKIRNSLLSIGELSDAQEFADTASSLKQTYSESPKNFHEKENISESWGFANCLTDEEIKSGLERVFRIINLRNIEGEISLIKQELMSEPNEKTFIRLAELKKHEEELKQEIGIQ